MIIIRTRFRFRFRENNQERDVHNFPPNKFPDARYVCISKFVATIKILWLIAAIREINEACLPVTHFPFDSYTLGNQTEDQKDREKEDVRGERIHRDRTSFCRISTERRA